MTDEMAIKKMVLEREGFTVDIIEPSMNHLKWSVLIYKKEDVCRSHGATVEDALLKAEKEFKQKRK